LTIVYLNGEFLPESQAKISIFDRGFLFGDSVYEVIPVFNQKFTGLVEHLERLTASLQAIHMAVPLSVTEWTAIFEKLIDLNSPAVDQCIYLQITRGAAENRRFGIPHHIKPTILAICFPSPKKPLGIIRKGLRAITLQDKRRIQCHIKSTALLPNVLAYQTALDQNTDEAILIRDGYANEATSSNLFIVKNNVLITPPLKPEILAGVTRKIILKIAISQQIPSLERNITEIELLNADEVWLTGSTKEIYPIVVINESIIGNGKPGPLWKKMFDLYQQYKTHGHCPSSYNQQHGGSQIE